MVKKQFRLLRLCHDDTPMGFDYLECFSPALEARFTPDSQKAFLFPTWEDFVQAATLLWLSAGPSDIMYEEVFVLSREVAPNGR